MKRRIAAPIGALLLMLATHAPAQVGSCRANAAPQCRDSQVISASGNSINVWGNGALSGAFEEVIAGSPSTVSIVIQGCADAGTCTTLDTYTTVANSVRAPTIAAPYAYYQITASWTGGTNVEVTVNSRLTTAAVQGSGGGGIANVTITTGTGVVSATCASNTLSGAVTMSGLGTANTLSFTPTTDLSSVSGWDSGALYFVPVVGSGSFQWRLCTGNPSGTTPGSSVTWNVSAK